MMTEVLPKGKHDVIRSNFEVSRKISLRGVTVLDYEFFLSYIIN